MSPSQAKSINILIVYKYNNLKIKILDVNYKKMTKKEIKRSKYS
mgnify:FL=1